MANPYLGFRTYKESDSELFTGREEDIKNIYDYISKNSMTILYANSGIGKSSVINAGLCPLLRANNYFPIYIRCNDYSSADNFDGLIIDVLSSQTKLSRLWHNSVENPLFLGNPIDDNNSQQHSSNDNDVDFTKATTLFKVRSIYRDLPQSSMFYYLDEELSKKSLWWFLRTREIYFEVMPGVEAIYTPLLIFDQFEEFFDKASSFDVSGKFFSWYNNVVSQITPPDVQKAYNEISNKYPQGHKFILDFNLKCKSLFSLRKEYIGQMDYWVYQNAETRNTAFLYNRYLLRPLQKTQAEQVINLSDKLQGKIEDILQYVGENEYDGYPAILLSVICYELVEQQECDIFIKEKSRNILLLAYKRAIRELCLPEKVISIIESVLVDKETAKKNRIKKDELTDAIDAEVGPDSEDVINKLIEHRLITKIGNYIEIVHDKLAEIISERVIKRFQIKERKKLVSYNRQELLNSENILCIGGRGYIDNYENFGGCDDERSSVFSAIMQTHASKEKKDLHKDLNKKERPITIKVNNSDSGNKNEGNSISISKSAYDTFLFSNKNLSDLTALSQLLDDTNSNKNHLCISFTDENCKSCPSLDGVYELEVSIKQIHVVHKNIEGNVVEDKPMLVPVQVTFYDKNRLNKVVNRFGFCGIKLKYDETGNEIERIYLDENNHPTTTTKCYSIIKRRYNDDGLPICTRYFDKEDKPCIMWDGNHGYNSEFNDFGQEVTRTFIGINGDNVQLRNGIYGQRYDYENQWGLRKTFVTNLGNDNNPCPDIKGYCKIIYCYDSKGRNNKQIFCDEFNNPKNEECGYAICTYGYNDHDLIASIRYYDQNYVPVKSNEGIYGSILEYDEYERPIFVGFIDYLGNPMANNEGYSFIKRTFDSIGIEISSSFFDYRRQPTFNKDGIHKIGAFYNSHTKLLEKLENYDILDNIIEGKDEWAKQIVHWDAEGRNILKIELFKKTSSEPYFFVFFNYSDDDHTVEREEVDNGVSRKALFKKDFAKRDIYYQPLNYTIDNGAHHVIYTYDRFSRKLKTLFFADDGSPYKDEDGDSGIETIYNGTGQEVGYYSLNEMGHRHLNRNGFSSVKWNNTHEGFIQEYYDIDGITPIINTAYLCHKRLIEDGITKKCWDINGNLCDSAMGYAYVHEWREQGEGTNIYRGFFNSKSEPVMYEGWHKICQTTSRTNVLKSFLDINGNLVSPYGYAAKKEITKTGLTSTANSIVLYYDQNMLPCDGPNPCDDNDAILAHKWELKGDGNAKRVFRAITSNRKRVKGSLLSQYEIVLLWLLIPFITIYYLLYELLLKGVWNVIKKRFTKSKEYVRAIVVEEVFDDVQDLSDDANTDGIQSACNLYGVKKGDVLLEFGDWRYDPSNDVNENIELFEKIFNESRNKLKKVTMARLTRESEGRVNPIIISFVAFGNIGARLTDRADAYDNLSLNLLEKKLTEIKLENVVRIIKDGDATQNSNVLRTIAYTFKDDGLLNEAIVKYEEAIESLLSSAKIRKLDLSQLYFELASCYQLKGNNVEAMAKIKDAIDYISEVSEGRYSLYMYMRFMGGLLIQEQDYVNAKKTCLKYITLAKDMASISQYADALDDMAFILIKSEEWEEARQYEKKAIQQLLQNDIASIELAQYYSRYSNILSNSNETKESMLYLEKAIDVFKNFNLTNEEANCWYELSAIYEKQNLYADAEKTIRQAILLTNEDSQQSINTQRFYRGILLNYLLAQSKFDEILFTAINERTEELPVMIETGVPYAIFEWGDWNISQNKSLESSFENDGDKLKHIVLFNNGTLVELNTEDCIDGLHIQSQYFDKESKKFLVEQYSNWLNSRKK